MPLALLGVILYWGLLALSADLRIDSLSISIYRQAGEAMLRGEIAYRDFFIEYPPGSLLVFVPPALFSTSEAGYATLFSSEMALALVATLVLTALAARRMRDSWVVPAGTFAAAAIMLYPVAVARYDAVVTLALAIAVFCAALGGRYLLLAYAALGFGAAAKLVPALATIPLALARGRVVRGFVVFLGVLAFFFIPTLLLGGHGFLASFAYHADRGLQVESLAASVLMTLGRVREVVFEYGAFEVRGPGVELATSLSLPISGILLLITLYFVYRVYRQGSYGPEAFPRYGAALILAFMLGSKVLSPQYTLWLLPLVPLSSRGIAVPAIFVAACFATTQVYPVHYGDVLALRAAGLGLLLARNLLLVLLWVLLLAVPERTQETP